VNGWLGAALGSEFDGIRKKITSAFSGAVDVDPNALQRVLTLPEAGDLHELDHFLPLLEALLANEQVSFDYRKSEASGGAPGTRIRCNSRCRKVRGCW
jgi:hypothetical protein